ncbi:MAG TPA: hypothetical protein PKC28_16750, partial [Bdellovibrionales bacterium]|nr:hypothetical protein [Bdellovibrionales bacterium]
VACRALKEICVFDDWNRQSTKSTYSFRLPEDLMADFERICKSNSITMTDVIIELVGDFVRQN